MAELTCSNPISRPDLSSGMNRANNQDWIFTTQNYLLNKNPDYFIYLYNVSQMDHEVSRPPLVRKMVIQARKSNEKYALVTRLPQPLVIPKGNVDSSEIDISGQANCSGSTIHPRFTHRRINCIYPESGFHELPTVRAPFATVSHCFLSMAIEHRILASCWDYGKLVPADRRAHV